MNSFHGKNASDMRISVMSDCLFVLFATHPQPNAFDSLTSTHEPPKQLPYPVLLLQNTRPGYTVRKCE